MMHKQFEELIQKALDREITPEEKRGLDLHLAECHDCRMLYEELLWTQEAILRLPELLPGSGFDKRVLAAIGFKRSLAWSKVWIGAGAAWLVSLIAFLLSPLSGMVLNTSLTKVPAVVRFAEGVRMFFEPLGRSLLPFLKQAVVSPYPFIGLTLSILMLVFLGKVITKEATCKES
jgi:hypothetical protein